MRNLFLLLPLLFAIAPWTVIAMEASGQEQEDLMVRWCEKGAAYSLDGQPFSPKIRNHNEQSVRLISKFVGEHSGGTVLILGPGPANDLPKDELLDKFGRIIMVDGYIKPMQEWLRQLPQKKSRAKNKVELVKMDLSGGFYKFFAENKELIKRALTKDFLQYLRDGKPSFDHYVSLIKSANLFVDLAQFRADVLVSSIVTSQIGMLTSVMVQEFLDTMTDDLEIQGRSTFLDFDARSTDENLTVFMTSFHQTHVQNARDAYRKAIRESRAKYIYYSDDLFSYELRSRDNFDEQLADVYQVIKSKKRAWSYGETIVSWYTFGFIPEKCGGCKEEIIKLTRCSACKRVYYCNQGCQRNHWPEHKNNCLKVK